MTTDSMQIQVAVVSGASSGLGRAIAHELARGGYDIALLSRREAELADTARECESYGVRTLVIPTDMSDETAVNTAADTIRQTLGGASVWVNAAGVYAAGSVMDVPLDDMKRVMDINFFGVVNGSRAAVKQLRQQSYGTLINIASGIGLAPLPYLGIYNASKAAVRAFDDSLRMELEIDGFSAVHVCTVYPSVMDTHIHQNGANYTGHRLVAPPPIFDPVTIARQVYKLTKHPKRELLVTPSTKIIVGLRAIAPALYERIITAYTRRFAISPDPTEPTTGNLYSPIERYHGMHGGWKGTYVRGETVTRVGIALSALGVVALAGAVYFARKQHHHVNER